jgi:hypothetical protein
MRGLAPLLVLLLLLSTSTTAPALHSVSHEANGFRYFLATERDTYFTYEYVPIEFSVTNISGDTLDFFSPCAGIFMCVAVWDAGSPFHPEPEVVWFDGCGCFTEVTFHELEPDGFYLRQPVWDMYSLYTEELVFWTGTYGIEATFDAYDPEWNSLGHTLWLDFELVSQAAGTPGAPETWGAIKALYR